MLKCKFRDLKDWMSVRSVDEALREILKGMPVLSSERVLLWQVANRIIAQDIVADTDQPTQANSSMDGFALHSKDLVDASADRPRTLPVVMHIAAGMSPKRSLACGEVARIMTGAPIPCGADAVVPVEDTDADWSMESPLEDQVRFSNPVAAGAYIRQRGEDIRAGQTVLQKGKQLRAAEIGLLATLGVVKPQVFRQPRVAILSSGDELVSPDRPLSQGVIRDSNSYMLASLVQQYGGLPIRLPVVCDNFAEIKGVLGSIKNCAPDLILSNAGVSVGAADFIHKALQELGTMEFWRVNMRPGKPLVFGRIQDIPFLGLPGNPVSSMVTFDVFVRPCLLKMGGSSEEQWPLPTISVRTGHDFQSDGRRSYLRVRLERCGDDWVAYSVGTQSSSAIMSMVNADGLLIIPEGQTHIEAGTSLELRRLNDDRKFG